MNNHRHQQWETELEQALSAPGQPVWQVRCFTSVDTTMESARQLLSSVTPTAPAVVVAENQTRGRGRQGRTWESPPQGFYGTITFATEAPLASLTGLSLVVGVATLELLSSLGCEVGLKWPNDVLDRNGRKVSGVLIELVQERGLTFVLIGIGINLVGQPESLKQEAASILGLSGRAIRPAAIAARLCPTLWQAWNRFQAQGFAPFKPEWTQHALFLDSELTIDVGQKEIVRGTFRGVSDEGHLLLEVAGKTRTIFSGHILER